MNIAHNLNISSNLHKCKIIILFFSSFLFYSVENTVGGCDLPFNSNAQKIKNKILSKIEYWNSQSKISEAKLNESIAAWSIEIKRLAIEVCGLRINPTSITSASEPECEIDVILEPAQNFSTKIIPVFRKEVQSDNMANMDNMENNNNYAAKSDDEKSATSSSYRQSYLPTSLSSSLSSSSISSSSVHYDSANSSSKKIECRLPILGIQASSFLEKRIEENKEDKSENTRESKRFTFFNGHKIDYSSFSKQFFKAPRIVHPFLKAKNKELQKSESFIKYELGGEEKKSVGCKLVPIGDHAVDCRCFSDFIEEGDSSRTHNNLVYIDSNEVCHFLKKQKGKCKGDNQTCLHEMDSKYYEYTSAYESEQNIPYSFSNFTIEEGIYSLDSNNNTLSPLNNDFSEIESSRQVRVFPNNYGTKYWGIKYSNENYKARIEDVKYNNFISSIDLTPNGLTEEILNEFELLTEVERVRIKQLILSDWKSLTKKVVVERVKKLLPHLVEIILPSISFDHNNERNEILEFSKMLKLVETVEGDSFPVSVIYPWFGLDYKSEYSKTELLKVAKIPLLIVFGNIENEGPNAMVRLDLISAQKNQLFFMLESLPDLNTRSGTSVSTSVLSSSAEVSTSSVPTLKVNSSPERDKYFANYVNFISADNIKRLDRELHDYQIKFKLKLNYRSNLKSEIKIIFKLKCYDKDNISINYKSLDLTEMKSTQEVFSFSRERIIEPSTRRETIVNSNKMISTSSSNEFDSEFIINKTELQLCNSGLFADIVIEGDKGDYSFGANGLQWSVLQ